jgi:hypothetical protein
MNCTISLSKGFVATISAEDFELVSQYAWRARYNPMTRSVYAVAYAYVNGRKTTIQMGRLILGLSHSDRRQADHANHDSLLNTRANLRIATPAENCRNRRRRSDNSSTFKGVSFHRPMKKWRVQIWLNKTNRVVGYFSNPIEAAHAYDAAAREHFGPFAHCNFPPPPANELPIAA